MYTIGQLSKMFDLPVSTLRYYDKEGLFLDLQRTSGIRKFNDRQVEALRVIECLKKSGLEIKDIRQFMKWCDEGPSTYQKRKDMFEKQKENIEAEMEKLNRTLSMIKFKCWYYEQALKDGSEEKIQQMIPDKLPEDIQELYDEAHKGSVATEEIEQ
ncbi:MULTISPECIES: MerR family transcriptional regulator [Succinivibrio]|jgi:DNA-binding transcriptional MerR regulator|uniref:MerR family transcriptional regulator n=1 Tax=Succinivibrio TaxID=83770 RepID=UPI0008E6E705|nr:MerR family transcriptional regulator [Succinivibrio dextrinosolvens]SFS78827.1 DNA-binding transcriptional regulator, MerR family [Succinivibrio dextrinosolvens]